MDIRDAAKILGINLNTKDDGDVPFTTDYKRVLGELTDLTMPGEHGPHVAKAVFVGKQEYWPLMKSFELLFGNLPGRWPFPVLLLEDLARALKVRASNIDPDIGTVTSKHILHHIRNKMMTCIAM